jgi:hypothetical protein
VLRQREEYDFRTIHVISLETLHSEEELEQALDDVDAALSLIRADLDSDDAKAFHSLEFQVADGPAVEPFGNASSHEYDPWNSASFEFWEAVGHRKLLRPKVMRIIDKAEALLVYAETLRRPVSSVWEDDETQLCEVMVSVLALMDLSYVPVYTRLLTLWDLDHEANQAEIIDQIIERHGLVTNTEALLYCRIVENTGQHGYAKFRSVLDQLQRLHSDLADVPFFRRVVEGLYEKDKKEGYHEITADYLPFFFKYCDSEPPKEAAKKVLYLSSS